MVKRRVVTHLDEEVIEKLKEKSRERYGKQSVYRICADLILKGLDDIEQGTVEEGLKGAGGNRPQRTDADKERDWREVFKPSTRQLEPRKEKR